MRLCACLCICVWNTHRIHTKPASQRDRRLAPAGSQRRGAPLGLSHTRRPSVGFRAARQRRYQIPPLRPVCRVRAARWLVLIIVAWRQKHVSRGTGLILFLTPDAWYWPLRARAGGSYSGLMSKTSKLADLNEYDNLGLIQPQIVLLLLLAFSSLSNITASTPAAKQHQIIVFIGGLVGWSHFDDLSWRLKTLSHVEQRALNYCVRVLACTCRSACAVAWLRRLPPYLESPPVCDRLKVW